MNTTNLHTASFDDIIFEGRNKAYGAFVLRQLYNRHLARALAITVALSLLLVSIPLVIQRVWPTVAPVIKDPNEVVAEPQVYIMPQQEATPAQPPVAHHQPVVVTPRTDVAPIVVKDELVTKPVPNIEASLPNDNTLTNVQPGEGVAGPGTVSGPSTLGSDTGVTTPAPPAKPFTHVEVMPEFAGGIGALRQYMQRNLRYPRQALSAAISGKVFVSFTVQADGSIADVQVIKGLGYGMDEEAARVVSKMPSWTPGKQNSQAVAVRYTMPITFQYE
ncbi:TonB family protein [Hymenobacter sp. BT635]|uniref:TonB family protein n=1 Tax=Hymenobacter nitidus TaxID=2880929 RepID=A0ABS8AEH0_9BACT|nr:energy transducer TonB [Hymenobacter nitidus]MCB2378828.1 TonB family protein [Hymenobacter nitidus]